MLKYRLRSLKKIKKKLISQTDATLKYRKVNIEIEQKSTKIINLVGYVILLLVLLDYIVIFTSSQLFNSAWSHSTAGGLVENVWSLLLGLLLVFYRRDHDIIKPKEFLLLKGLSWLTLVIGICYFLLVPFFITNGFRIHRNNKAQVDSKIYNSKEKVQQFSQELDSANPEQLNILLKRYQESAPEIEVNSTTALKDALVSQLQETQQKTQQQVQNQLDLKKENLFKTTFKWLLGAIISGVCFILIWRHTLWVRAMGRGGQKK